MFALATDDNRLALTVTHEHAVMHALLRLLRPGVEKLFAFDQLNAVTAAVEAIGTDESAEDKILRVLGVGSAVEAACLERIPTEGPLLVVANHPFGGVEGLLLASLLKKRRPDVRIMANRLLGHLPRLRDLFILVDPFGGADAARANVGAMKETLRVLESGGVVGVFPAGEVSHYAPRIGEVRDPEWSDTVARIARKSGATVLPVLVEGHNGPLFHLLGMLHPRLRTARLPHEFLNKRGLRITVRIGHAIPPQRIARFKNAADLTAYLRIRTYLQRGGDATAPAIVSTEQLEPVAPPVPVEHLRRDIAALPAEALLVEHEQFRVYIAEASHIPNVLREIGRLREVTFRGNNEGTGRAIDLDRFDMHYLHLFLWHAGSEDVVAAYRLGATDTILPEQGKAGLYTRTLFNIRKRLLKQIDPALEMGRSFVREEYQRQFLPLMLLWKGIGSYVARNPRYRNLFGPVSINAAYSSTSQQLLMRFLRENSMDERARLVRAKLPPRAARLAGFDPSTMSTVVRDLSDLSALIAEIEEDHKDVPILLKQYLKLGGVLLGFNIDPDFSNVLDGLILVDLARTDPRQLERYMGKDGAAAFLAHHK